MWTIRRYERQSGSDDEAVVEESNGNNTSRTRDE